MGIIGSLIKSVTRVGKVLPDFLLGTSAEVMGPAMRKAKGSIFDKARAGFRALESDVTAQTAKNGNFFRRTGKNLKETPKAIKAGAQSGYKAAKIANKSGLWGGIKGAGKAIAKKMPFIGAALTLIWEAPNIFKAFKEGGFSAGMKEVGGAGVELGCMATGAAIGSAFGPIGTVVGGLVGSIVGVFTRGKTYTDKQKEAEELGAQGIAQYTPQEINTLKQYGLSDEEVLLAMQKGYTVEDVQRVLAQAYEQPIPQTNSYSPMYDPSLAIEIEELERENKQLRQQLELQKSNPVQPQPQTDIYNPMMYNPLAINSIFPGVNPTGNKSPGTYNDDIMFQQLFGFTPKFSYNPQATGYTA